MPSAVSIQVSANERRQLTIDDGALETPAQSATAECKIALPKRSNYSFADLRQLMLAFNRRHLESIRTIGDPTSATKILEKNESARAQRAQNLRESRYIKRLRAHGIIKRVGRRYKYYITVFGRRVVLTGLKLRELLVVAHVNALLSPT